MTQAKDLVKTIVESIQNKKGFGIITVDLRKIETAPAQFFVISCGNTPSQVEAIVDEVEEKMRTVHGEKPAAVVGKQNGIWMAMDYGTVMVHTFVPSAREHYDLENLWKDAQLTEIPDVD